MIAMNLLNKKLEDFEPISLDDLPSDDHYFDLLYGLLKKINKSGQKSSNTLSALKDEILTEVKHTSSTVDEVRDERAKVLHDNDKLKKGVIEYNDIVENLHNAALSTKNAELYDMTKIALKALEQINAKLGVIRIPSDKFTKPDAEYHMIHNAKATDNELYDGQIANTIENGFRRGNEILRRASVEIYKCEDIANE
jgi:molecular chaperone GrpE (heat shock protein)